MFLQVKLEKAWKLLLKTWLFRVKLKTICVKLKKLETWTQKYLILSFNSKLEIKSNFRVENSQFFSLFWMLVSSPTIRLLCNLFKCHGCINNATVVGLCSELLMRLSYYIHLRFGKKLSAHIGIEPRSVRSRAVYSTPKPDR